MPSSAISRRRSSPTRWPYNRDKTDFWDRVDAIRCRTGGMSEKFAYEPRTSHVLTNPATLGT